MLRRRFRPGTARRRFMARLRQAHRHRAEGRYAQAAAEYSELAELAERRQAPQAPRLYLAAGRAAIEAGDLEAGQRYLLHGLELLERDGPPSRLRQVIQRIIGELESDGHHALAEQIEAFAQQHGVEPEAVERQRRGRLPPKCPQCGGTVHPADVDWIDSQSAECGYCGSVLQTIT